MAEELDEELDLGVDDTEDKTDKGESEEEKPTENFNNDAEKKPNPWKVIRQMQKTITELQKPKPTKSETVDPEYRQAVDKLTLSEKKREFADEHSLSKAEVDHVFAIASGYGVEPATLLKEKDKYGFVHAGLEAIKAQRRVADNTPNPSSPSLKVFSGKSFSEVPAEEQHKSLRENYAQAIESVKQR